MELKNYRPYPGKIIGKIVMGNYETESGILVVDSLKGQKPRKIKVSFVGGPFLDEKGKPGVYRAAPGQTAHFKLAQGERVRFDREDYLVLRNEDIVAVEV